MCKMFMLYASLGLNRIEAANIVSSTQRQINIGYEFNSTTRKDFAINR